MESLNWLKTLVMLVPNKHRQPSSITLFEALNILNLENPNSDFLAWLLDPMGPLTNMWLLQIFFEKVIPDERWPGKPTVEREVSVNEGRADIVVSWDAFRLIIENKVRSKEGDGQVSRYLSGFGIANKAVGRVIYLTPHGDWPKSVQTGDERVVACSYRQLAEFVEAGLRDGKEPTERGRIFAAELRAGIHRLLNMRIENMQKPTISEASKLLLANGKHFEALKQQAIDESATFIGWMTGEAQKRVALLLGPQMISLHTRYGAYFRLPEWKRGGIEFGIAYGMASDPHKSLIVNHQFEPAVGVAVFLPNGDESKAECAPVSDALFPFIEKAWPHPNDLKNAYYGWPMFRYVPIPSDGDMDRWADQVFVLFDEITKQLRGVLSDAAIAIKK